MRRSVSPRGDGGRKQAYMAKDGRMEEVNRVAGMDEGGFPERIGRKS